MLTVVTIAQNKSLGFLYKTNAFNVYFVLIISALLNWSTIITKYNLAHPYGTNQQIDYNYLFSLDRSNTALLIDHYDALDESLQSRLDRRIERVSSYEAYDSREWVLGKSNARDKVNNKLKTKNK